MRHKSEIGRSEQNIGRFKSSMKIKFLFGQAYV